MWLNLSAPFVRRPVASTLIAVALAVFGLLAFRALPVSSLPDVDFPTIAVTAVLPGADPQTIASSVALPLEHQFSAIAGITEMTSTSYTGSVRIVLQFELSRDIDGAARDVQAAISAARAQLPDEMKTNPSYRKVNPAEAPVMVLALTSDTASSAAMYDKATTLLQQTLLQTEGVGDVMVGGGSLPAVRVELDPKQLQQQGISLEQIRVALAKTNANGAKGNLDVLDRSYTLMANDNIANAADYAPLVIRSDDGAITRLRDVADVYNGNENVHNFGLINGRNAVAIIISKQPGANVVATVDRIRQSLPQLNAMLPAQMQLSVALDRTQTIRASLFDVELTLLVAILLVVGVTWLFFRDWRATLLPAIAVPLSLLGTFAIMWSLGYSLNILSLMALTIATGFVVDDAIVVVENIMRHLALGKSRIEAILDGTREVGFTVFSISISLVAVFIPLLLMSGLAGRLLREFAVTLSVAILVSMLVSLTITPTLSRIFLKSPTHSHQVSCPRWYATSLQQSLQHPRLMMLLTVSAFLGSVVLLAVIPKGFFPQQDTGLLFGRVQAPQNISFTDMQQRFTQVIDTLKQDPALENVFGFIGGNGVNANNTGVIYATLTPLNQPRRESATSIVARLQHQFAAQAGLKLQLQAIQDIAVGGLQTAGQYQYTLSADSMVALDKWAPQVEAALKDIPLLNGVNSDKQDQSLTLKIDIDRQAAARLGVRISDIDQTLYDAFGQRQVSTIYQPMNQYHVVMALKPQYWQEPSALDNIYVTATNTSTLVPLSAIAHFAVVPSAISLSHKGLFPSVTLSFNLQPGVAIGAAINAIEQKISTLRLPDTIIAGFSGTAKASATTVSSMPILMLAAIVAVYIVLGMLYENLYHPLTILSTLPSAGLGALLALFVCGFEFSIIALIGIILLIGIVKKNAIMLIDFALTLEREQQLSPIQSIYQACLTRFRPIMMTTLAALFGALPLVFGHGYGAELRHPLGVSIIGGLLLSQLLTLYSTPAIYLYISRLQNKLQCR
ncbi:efflux RND transporter permease subunit [Shewanella sp.]|uniref:efflux RND transporter permease subunit n=1 Tax=Shewanella sp. TaxID=50422 RepID=UPI003D0DD05D